MTDCEVVGKLILTRVLHTFKLRTCTRGSYDANHMFDALKRPIKKRISER